MRFFKFGLYGFFMAQLLALQGCGSIPSMAEAARMPAPDYGQERRAARWVEGSRESVWARLQTLNPQGQLVAALGHACARGMQVEVIAPVGQRAAAQQIASPCIHVWLTNHPEVRRLPDTLLLDGHMLVIEGNLDSMKRARVLNEYSAQAYVKQHEAFRP